MSLDRDDSVDITAAQPIALGGREFLVAPLSLRQIIAIADHVPAVARLTVQDLAGDKIMPFAEIVFAGLRRVYPKLTRDEFFDLPMSVAELVEAVPVVIAQGGGGKRDAPAGESTATSPPAPPPGGSSSPSS